MDTSNPQATVRSSALLAATRLSVAATILWCAAALGAHLASLGFDNVLLRFAARLVVIWLCGGLLARLAGPLCGRTALLVGVGWAAAAMGTELYLTADAVQGWYELLGNPTLDPDWMRSLTAAAWLLAPRLSSGD